MPELPEVQTVVNNLSTDKLLNKKIVNCKILYKKVIYNSTPNQIYKDVLDNIIKEIFRIGKYIVIQTNNNFIVFHLRMTGYLYHDTILPINRKHLRAYFVLDNNSYLLFEDIRKFGGFYIYNNLNKLKVGIDPLSKDFTVNHLKNIVLKRTRTIKSFFLNQKIVSGLGNIYIDEILWHSRIKPTRKSNSLKYKEILALHKHIISILIKSIEFHGTTIINFKFDNMKTGKYKKYLKVYGRTGLNCFNCNKIILSIKVLGRTTHFCPKCQR